MVIRHIHSIQGRSHITAQEETGRIAVWHMFLSGDTVQNIKIEEYFRDKVNFLIHGLFSLKK